jgi:hypothetical protein
MLAAALPATAQAQSLTDLAPDAVAANGPITALERVDDLVYVRGDFTKIGIYTGSGLGLDPATGARDPRYPVFNGQVSDVLPDGQGGWFVGGDFQRVNGLAYDNLAHVRADGSLDAAFRPEVDHFVDSLATDGERIFFGGYFDRVNGRARTRVAAVDRATGTLDESFKVEITEDADGFVPYVTELAYAPASGERGARLFIGADRLYAVDPTSGENAAGWNGPTGRREVRALAVLGERVYVAGTRFDAFDVGTGTEDEGFIPGPLTLARREFDGRVHVILPDGDRLLVGGGFEGTSLVALNPQTGAVDGSFAAEFPGEVYDLARFGDRLWVGGRFNSAQGEPATNLAAVDATTGARDRGLAPRVDGPVYALAPGEMLFAGGEIALAGYSARRGYAALQSSSGALHPAIGAKAAFGHASSPYYDYEAGAGRLFSDDGVGAIRVFGLRTGRAVRPRRIRVKRLSAFAVDDERLYIAQALSERFFPRNRLTIRSARTGRLISRAPLELRGYITALEPHRDRLFISGSFKRTRSNGQKANIALIKVNPETGEVVDSFDPHINGPVYSMTSGGGRLIVSGIFRIVGPKNDETRRPGFAAVETTHGAVDPRFAPRIYGGHTRELELLKDELFTSICSYCGGHLISGETARRAALEGGVKNKGLFAAERAGSHLFLASNPAAPAQFGDHADVHVILRVRAPN